MNSRKVGIALIVVAVAIATVLLALGGCAPVDDIPHTMPPAPADVLRKFRVGEVTVAEFRDSAGRLCVLAATVSADGRGGRAVALDCVQLAPLDYESLPEAFEQPSRL